MMDRSNRSNILERARWWILVAAAGFLDAGILLFYFLNGQVPWTALLGVIAIAGAATAVWRNRLWGAYILALAEMLKFAGECAASGKISAFVIPMICLAGAVALTGAPSALSPKISMLPLSRILIAGVVADIAAGLISGVFGGVMSVTSSLAPATVNGLADAIQYALWVVAFAIAAKRAPWSFETALGTAMVAFVAQAIEMLIGSIIGGLLVSSNTVVFLTGAGITLIACGVLSEGIAVALSPYKPELSPELVESLREWKRSQDIQAAGAGHEEEDWDIFRRLLFSKALFAFALRDIETAKAYAEMFEGLEPSVENIGEFGKQSVQFISKLSKKAGRKFPPISAAENAQFLIDQLRGVGYIVISSKPTDNGRFLSECEIICSHPGCFVIDRVSLSEEEESRFRSGQSSYFCASHQK